jgi:hypothetical protein
MDAHSSVLLLFILVPGQGMVCVPLEHGYGAWENKDKVHNGDHNDSDREGKYYLDGYYEYNNTTYKSQP